MSFCHFVIVIFVADACATLFQRLWPLLPIQPSRFHREIILMSELRGVRNDCLALKNVESKTTF